MNIMMCVRICAFITACICTFILNYPLYTSPSIKLPYHYYTVDIQIVNTSISIYQCVQHNQFNGDPTTTYCSTGYIDASYIYNDNINICNQIKIADKTVNEIQYEFDTLYKENTVISGYIYKLDPQDCLLDFVGSEANRNIVLIIILGTIVGFLFFQLVCHNWFNFYGNRYAKKNRFNLSPPDIDLEIKQINETRCDIASKSSDMLYNMTESM